MKKDQSSSLSSRVSTTTVVVDEARDVRPLSAEEERVLRMRAGASLPGNARLESKLDGVNPEFVNEVTARLRLIEAHLLGAFDEPEDAPEAPAVEVRPAVRRAAPVDSRKSRIVAALKSKPSAR